MDDNSKEIVGDSSNMEIIRLGLKAEQTTLLIHDDESNVRSLEDQSSFVANIKNVKSNHVFNTAGPGVDECESHKTETIRAIENRIQSGVGDSLFLTLGLNGLADSGEIF